TGSYPRRSGSFPAFAESAHILGGRDPRSGRRRGAIHHADRNGSGTLVANAVRPRSTKLGPRQMPYPFLETNEVGVGRIQSGTNKNQFTANPWRNPPRNEAIFLLLLVLTMRPPCLIGHVPVV